MASVRKELEDVRSDVEVLLSVAKEQTSVSDDLLARIDNLRGEVDFAARHYENLAEDAIESFKHEFALLQSDLARAIAITGGLHYKGQLKQAEAIENVGKDLVASSFLGGLFNVLSAVVLGGFIKSGIEIGATKVASAIEQQSAPLKERLRLLSKDQLKQVRQTVLIEIIGQLQETHPHVTFKDVVDFAQSVIIQGEAFYTPDEARRSLYALIADGVVQDHSNGELTRLKINPKHSTVAPLR